MCAAYGFARNISDDEILVRLVHLNHERAAEEHRGLVRWLRPAYQHPTGTTQSALDIEDEAAQQIAAKDKTKMPFPLNIAEQARAVRNALLASSGIVTPAQLAKTFQRAPARRIEELLQTLVLLGQARQIEAGKYAA